MKTFPGVILTLAAAALLAGCASSPAARIAEKAAVFQTLSPSDQAVIRNGEIEEGFTRDMVYMALGKPSSVDATGGGGEKWTYRNFYPSEHVASESIYARPSRNGRGGSGSLQEAVGKSGGLSDASAHGGYSEGAGPGSGGGGMGGEADVSSALMEVWFNDGRVSAFKLTP